MTTDHDDMGGACVGTLTIDSDGGYEVGYPPDDMATPQAGDAGMMTGNKIEFDELEGLLCELEQVAMGDQSQHIDGIGIADAHDAVLEHVANETKVGVDDGWSDRGGQGGDMERAHAEGYAQCFKDATAKTVMRLSFAAIDRRDARIAELRAEVERQGALWMEEHRRRKALEEELGPHRLDCFKQLERVRADNVAKALLVDAARKERDQARAEVERLQAQVDEWREEWGEDETERQSS